jgi:ParB family chromosome partitioning protein
MTRQALGKGIQALIPEAKEEGEEEKKLVELEIDKIKPNPFQPRESLNPEKLTELANSIKEKGLIQPIVVRKSSTGFELIAGDRRLKAARSVGLKLIPALVKENLSKAGMLELTLIENIQREDLNPIEAARGYRRLVNELGVSQNDISNRVGKERSTIANTLRLLSLPESIQQLILKDQLSEGHARAILAAKNVDQQIILARRIVKEGLSVREAEALVYPKLKTKERKRRLRVLAPRLQQVEDRLKEFFGTSVRVVQRKKRGRIEIEFYSDDDLDRILEILKLVAE